MFEKIGLLFSKKNKGRNTNTLSKKRTSFYGNEDSFSFIKRKRNPSILHIYKSISINYKRNTFLFIGIPLLLILFISVFIFISILNVKDIYIYRQDSIINIDQAYSNIEYIRGKNILLLDTGEIAERLQKSQKSISSIEFDVKLPRRININIASYDPIFQTEKYLILSNGVVISKDSKKYLDIPLIQVSKDIEEYAIFGNTLNIESLKNIHTLIKEGRKNILGFSFDNIRYYIAERELLVMHDSGTIFIFDLDNDISSQIEKLAVYSTEKGDLQEKKYIYIDIRIPEKLFLCGVDYEYNCRENLQYIYGDFTFDRLQQVSSEPLQ